MWPRGGLKEGDEQDTGKPQMEQASWSGWTQPEVVIRGTEEHQPSMGTMCAGVSHGLLEHSHLCLCPTQTWIILNNLALHFVSLISTAAESMVVVGSCATDR